MRTLGETMGSHKMGGGQASKENNAYYQGNEVLCFGGNFEWNGKKPICSGTMQNFE